MDTPSYGSNRDRETARRTTPPGPGTTPLPSDPAGHAIAAAEEVVCAAWVQVLIECRDRAEAAAKAASVRCDDARRTLATALVERAPAAIASAHAGLEQALATARSTSRACDRANAGIALELDLLAPKTGANRADADIGRQAGTMRHADVSAEAPRRPSPAKHLWVFRRITP